MDGTAITALEKIIRDREAQIITVNGKEYSPIELKRVYDDPRPKALPLATLTSLIEYLNDNTDGLELETLLILVRSHRTVELVTDIHGEKNERHTVVTVEADVCESYPFGKWLTPEEFNISIRSRFEHSPDLSRLTTFVSSIDIKAEDSLQDNGVVQSAATKRSISGALTDREEAPAIVQLTPYRTFGEITQPSSQFLFRMTSKSGRIECALFEADGGIWKNEARVEIKRWIQEQLALPGRDDLAGIPILA